MSTRERAVDRGSRRGRNLLIELGSEARRARLLRSLSQARVGEVVGISRNQIRRIELGQAPHVALIDVARLLSVLGLELSARAYPDGEPLRDAAQIALLGRIRRRLAPSAGWSTEVALPGYGERRAWDAVVRLPMVSVAVEAETRLRDLQAVERRLGSKCRDDPRITRVILLLADTHVNRLVVQEYHDDLLARFPVSARLALRKLAAGEDPGGDSLVLL